MKWFGVDSDTPGDPKIRRVLREFGNGGMGALFRIWCYVAQHGATPGKGIDESGRPFKVADLAEAAGATPEKIERLLTVCAEEGHIDTAMWTRARTVFLPAMARRADEYSKKLARKGRGSQGSFLTDLAASPETVRTVDGQNPPTRQDNTPQEITSQQEDGGDRPSKAELESWFTDTFWPAYPEGHKVGKPFALKALLKLKPTRGTLTIILAGIERWKASRKWQEGFVEHPSTFLNQERFNDMPPAIPTKPTKPTRPPEPGRTGSAPSGKYAGLVAGRPEVS